MSNLYEDHAAAFTALLTGAGLTAYDTSVPDSPGEKYVLIRPSFTTLDGVSAPDATSLTLASVALDVRIYCYSVGVTAQSARAVAARCRAAVLDQVLTVASRSCHPVRFDDGQPERPNEEVPGSPVYELVEIYRWRSVPA